MRIQRTNRIILIVALILISFGGLGYVYATGALNLTSKQEEVSIQPQMTASSLQPLPQKIKDELKPKSQQSPIELSEEEKIQLYKQGFTFDEIDLAVQITAETEEKDVEKVLKEHKQEVKNFKEKIDQSRMVVNEQSDAPDLETEKYWKSQGYTRSEINIAFSVSKRSGKLLEEVITGLKNGELQLDSKVFEKGDENK